MKTIKNEVKAELIIKKSRFIALLYNISNEDQVNLIISSVKNEYKNATHYCYAYIINDIKRYSDDGEPTGTAGTPILNTLEKNELDAVLCIVVRYFGGIKLGAGGLIRAYGKCVREALETAEVVHINKCYNVSIIFSYEELKDINFIINKMPIISKDFSDNISYTIMVNKNEQDIIERLELAGATIVDIKDDYYIE